MPFGALKHSLSLSLLGAPEVNVGEWHSRPTNDHPLLVTRELTDVLVEFKVPHGEEFLQRAVQPNLPWAEEHFLERVSGEPLNPPPSHKNWPWAHQQHQTIAGERFSHTYPERYWPKQAGLDLSLVNHPRYEGPTHPKHRGIRYEYGDLDDVVDQLRRNGNTRQAVLPVFFPEDTGAVHGERVPCSIAYHFMIRDGYLSCRYFLRSCDFVRHFADDMYMTARLMQWVAERVPGAMTGKLVALIGSLHIMRGDEKMLELSLKEGGR